MKQAQPSDRPILVGGAPLSQVGARDGDEEVYEGMEAEVGPDNGRGWIWDELLMEMLLLCVNTPSNIPYKHPIRTTAPTDMPAMLAYLRKGLASDRALDHLGAFWHAFRNGMVLVPLLVHPDVLPSNHHIYGQWCMLSVSPEGYFVFDPFGGSGEYPGTVRIAIHNWLGQNHGMMDGGGSTMVIQGGRSNCGV